MRRRCCCEEDDCDDFFTWTDMDVDVGDAGSYVGPTFLFDLADDASSNPCVWQSVDGRSGGACSESYTVSITLSGGNWTIAVFIVFSVFGVPCSGTLLYTATGSGTPALDTPITLTYDSGTIGSCGGCTIPNPENSLTIDVTINS